MEHIISFPGLGLEFNINRVAFDLFGKDIYWYGIIIAVGFLLGTLYATRRAKDYNLTSDHIFDVLLYATPISIISARIYYVIFEWNSYKDNWTDIFKIWEGGIAIYGAIIGGALTILVYCKVKNLHFLDFADCAAPALMIGQFIGRWGNFVNGEAHGGDTTLPWRMNIGQTIAEAGSVGVHPTFFYESFWNFIGFIAIYLYSKKVIRRYPGQIFLIYVAWYGLGRFFIEGMRTDSLYFMGTGLRVSQILAIVSCIVAVFFMFKLSKKAKVEIKNNDIKAEE